MLDSQTQQPRNSLFDRALVQIKRDRGELSGRIGRALLDPTHLVLFGVWVFALAIRTIELADVPRGFFTDEASFGLNAHLILTTGKDEYGEFMPFLFRSFGEYKLPVFVYAQIPVQAVLGMDEFSVRFTSALLGSFTVVAVYLLAREMFERLMPAFTAACFVAILPWHIHISRTGLGDVVALPLFLTLALYLFLRAVRTGASFLPSAALFGLCLYTYRPGWVILPPLLLVLALIYRRELWQRRRQVGVGLAILVLMLVPIALHLLTGDSDRTSQVSIFKVDTERTLVAIFWDFYKSYYTFQFLFEDGPISDPVTRHYLPGHGMLYPFMTPLIVAGLVGLLVKRNREAFVILALLVFFPLGGALSDASPIATRASLGSVAFPLVAAAGVGYVANYFLLFPRWTGRVALGTGLALLTVVAAVGFFRYQDRYFNEYPTLASGYWGWQDGAEEILHLFDERQSQYDELFLDGHFNAPTVFIPFYLGDSCPKCRIGGFERFSIEKRQLFAFRTENEDLKKWNYVVRDTLFYPDGKPSFLILELVGKR